MMRVKICGLTNLEDALAAASLGADALGFIFAPSPRRVSPRRARDIIRRLPGTILTVGVFVDAEPDYMGWARQYCGLDFLQLHGSESEALAAALGPRVIKALAAGPEQAPAATAYPQATLLLDTACPSARGGSGRSFDWTLAAPLARQRPLILAGGLEPANVELAIKTVRPFAVDVSSGVEREPGRKDHDKLAAFISRAKRLRRPA